MVSDGFALSQFCKTLLLRCCMLFNFYSRSSLYVTSFSLIAVLLLISNQLLFIFILCFFSERPDSTWSIAIVTVLYALVGIRRINLCIWLKKILRLRIEFLLRNHVLAVYSIILSTPLRWVSFTMLSLSPQSRLRRLLSLLVIACAFSLRPFRCGIYVNP